MIKKRVPEVSIRRDMRISLERNWDECVVPAIAEAKVRGVLVTPLTVCDDRGVIVGWFLHGWVPPPGIVLSRPDPQKPPEEKPFNPDYSI